MRVPDVATETVATDVLALSGEPTAGSARLASSVRSRLWFWVARVAALIVASIGSVVAAPTAMASSTHLVDGEVSATVAPGPANTSSTPRQLSGSTALLLQVSELADKERPSVFP